MRFSAIFSRAAGRPRRVALAGAVATALLACTTSAYTASAYATATPPSRDVVQPAVSAPDHSVGFDGTVWASVYVGSTIYVGGEFRHAIVGGHLVPRLRLAAVDARTGALLPWAPAANNIIRGMTAAGSWLYVAGAFTTVGGQPRAGLASLDLRTGAPGPLRHSVSGAAYALAAGGGRLYVGGVIGHIDGRPVSNLAAINLRTGALDTTFRATADDRVSTMAVGNGRLYVGGHFRRLDGSAGHPRLGAVRLLDGRLDGSFHAYAPYWTMAITLGPGAVYAGLAGPGGRTVRYRLDGAAVWTAVTDGDVQAAAYLNGVVYAGGHFNVACPRPSRTPTSWCPARMVTRHKLAALDAATGRLTGWNPGTDRVHGIMTMSATALPRRLAAGGDFTLVNGVPHGHFAQWTNP